MSTYRVHKNNNFFVASNKPFNDSRLTWEARGVMAYLLSKPDGWQCRNYDLVNQGQAGKHIIKRIMKELQTYGYMYRTRTSEDNKKITWCTEIYESPDLNPYYNKDVNSKAENRTIEKNSKADFSMVENLEVEKSGHIINTDSQVNTDSNKDNNNDLTEFWKKYESEIGGISPLISQRFNDYAQECPEQWMIDAVKLAAENNARRANYIYAILDRCIATKTPPGPKPKSNGGKRNGTSRHTTQNTSGRGTGSGLDRAESFDPYTRSNVPPKLP